MGGTNRTGIAIRAIMIEAEQFNHDLTIQFGVLSGDCKNETDFVQKSAALVKEMSTYDLADMDWIFWQSTCKGRFSKGLKPDFRKY